MMGNFPFISFISFVPFILSSLFSLFSLFPPFAPPIKKRRLGITLCPNRRFVLLQLSIYLLVTLKIYAHNLVDAVDVRYAIDGLLKLVERVHREVDSAYCNAVDILRCESRHCKV